MSGIHAILLYASCLISAPEMRENGEHGDAGQGMRRFAPIEATEPVHIRIAAAIRTAIRRGELAVGERLPLEELGKEFGVSRMPVREALIRLERERLVEFHPRRGAQVAGITAVEIDEITHLRRMLETDALRAAAGRFRSSDSVEARRILAEARLESDPDRVADLHWQFHRCLYAPSDRPLQLELIDTLHANVDRFFRMEWREVGLRRDWVEDHETILSAIERGDVDAAVATIDTHMISAAERVRARLA